MSKYRHKNEQGAITHIFDWYSNHKHDDADDIPI